MNSHQPPELTVHKAGNGYIGRLRVSEDIISNKSSGKDIVIPQTFFIQDRSGSMGQNAARVSSVVIPGIARKYFHLKSDDMYTLITFDSRTDVIVTTVAQAEQHPIHARGMTSMNGVFPAMLKNLDHANPHVRIVAISDGLIQDTNETLLASTKAAEVLKESFHVSATAVRLFTSASQPDTRALASILQLNTSEPGTIIDVQAASSMESLNTIIDTIGLALESKASPHKSAMTLTASTKCLLRLPWAEASNELKLTPPKEDNKSLSIWLSSMPKKASLNELPVKIKEGDAITHDTLSFLLQDKIDYFLQHLRVLKVLGSTSAIEETSRIVNYFQDLESSLPPPSDLESLLQDGSLTGRVNYFKTSLMRRIKSVTIAMQEIANDERVNKLNLAQQADYLRQTGNGASRNHRALARRAEGTGFNFEDTIRAEILSMAAHVQTLDGIDDSEHAVSFYSRATTLEGIRCMVELANDADVLNNLTAAEMLRLFNIVGIPAVGPVGDYPDPTTFNLQQLQYGAFVSVADITMALQIGGNLKVPGEPKDIVTAIPFFEDRRVQAFLQRYARSSLEYIYSVGMRRMIADVPHTYASTIRSGVWRMVQELDAEKTQVRIKLFSQLVLTFENAAGGAAQREAPLLTQNQDQAKAHYSGLANLAQTLAPILCLVREGQTSNMPRVLRALYSREAYLAMRQATRDDPVNGRKKALDTILGIDFSSESATPLPPMFSRTTPQHCCRAVVNKEALKKFEQYLWYLPYATLLEPFFSVVTKYQGDDEYIQQFRNIPSMSRESITASLDLPKDVALEDLVLFNIVEGLLYRNNSSRVDADLMQSKLDDLGRPGVGKAMIESYVASRYQEDFEQRLAIQATEEKKILETELLEKLCLCENMEDFLAGLQMGHSRGDVSISINRSDVPGFRQLHDDLMDLSIDVPLRSLKLSVIYSGRRLPSIDCGSNIEDKDGKPYFNGGNPYRTNWEPLKELLLKLGEDRIWMELEEDRNSRMYQYRGGASVANRHGHSNDFPSFYAYRCSSLEMFCQNVSEEVWTSYMKDHSRCCGVASFIDRKHVASLLSE